MVWKSLYGHVCYSCLSASLVYGFLSATVENRFLKYAAHKQLCWIQTIFQWWDFKLTSPCTYEHTPFCILMVCTTHSAAPLDCGYLGILVMCGTTLVAYSANCVDKYWGQLSDIIQFRVVKSYSWDGWYHLLRYSWWQLGSLYEVRIIVDNKYCDFYHLNMSVATFCHGCIGQVVCKDV